MTGKVKQMSTLLVIKTDSQYRYIFTPFISILAPNSGHWSGLAIRDTFCTPITHNNRQKDFLGNGSISKFSACSYGVTRILPSQVRQLIAYSFTPKDRLYLGWFWWWKHMLMMYLNTAEPKCVHVCVCVCVCVRLRACVCVTVGEILE